MIFFPAGPALVLGTVSCFPDLFLRLKRMQKVTLNVLDGIERNGSLETNFSLPASPRHLTELLPFTTTNATSAPCLFLYLRGRPYVCCAQHERMRGIALRVFNFNWHLPLRNISTGAGAPK
jgi:hypothetical protein